jgi:hypothetical protein
LCNFWLRIMWIFEVYYDEVLISWKDLDQTWYEWWCCDVKNKFGIFVWWKWFKTI